MTEMHTREAESLQRELSLYAPRIELQVGDGTEHGKGVMCRTRDYKYVRRVAEGSPGLQFHREALRLLSSQ